MVKKIASFSVILFIYSSSATADFLGLYVGGGVWKHDASGSFNSTIDRNDVVDVKADLGFSDESESYLWAAFDHPIPLLPNIRLEATSLNHDGFANNISYAGGTVNGPSTVRLDSTDVIFYYRILDNWVNFDLGLTMRKVEGEFTVGSGASNTQPFSETVPMLYLAAQFDLPFTGFSVGGDYNVVNYDGNEYNDMRIRALYEMGVVGFELGLRNTTVNLDNVDNINADLEFKGMMMGVFLHF